MIMSKPFPQPDTFYRIGSVDFDLCLQLWDVEDDSVVLRPLKEKNLQQWLFVKEGTADNKYKIMAAATQSSRLPVYLYIDKRRWDDSKPYDGSGRPKAVGASNATIWEVYQDPKGEGEYVLTTNGVNDDQEIFLMVNEDGKLDAVAKEKSANPGIKPSMRWDIEEYWTVVPKGTYRIRTLKGTNLEMDSDLTQLSVAPENSESHQEWDVEPKGNGKYVIVSHLDEQVFLGLKQGRDGIADVAASKVPVEWFIKSLGQYIYSITFDYVVDARTTLTLALSIADKDSVFATVLPKALLKPTKITHDQIWLFERFDRSSSVDKPKDKPKDKPPSYSTTTREIAAGNYSMYNMQTCQYITYSGSSPVRWIPSSANYSITVSYPDSTNAAKVVSDGYFMRFSGNSDSGFILCANNQKDGSTWVMERVENSPQGNIYYISLSTNRSLVISGNTMEDTGRIQVFTVARRKRGDKSQQWRFDAC